MKKLLLSACSLMLAGAINAQWNITSLGATDTITFDATMAGVNNGIFAGAGFVASPANGQLDSDAWKWLGLSNGNTAFGGSYTTGDYAKGPSGGGIFSGGVYAFGVAAGDTAMGVQPTGSDWTPGDVVLKIVNGTSQAVDSVFIAYDLYVNNDADRANSFNLSYAIGTSSFTAVPALDYESDTLSQGSVIWVANSKSTALSVTIPAGDSLFLMWSGDDEGGSGSRDEFALDNITVTFNVGTPPPPPPAVVPTYAIELLNNEDANGVADSLGTYCFIKGVVIGPDFDGNNGYSFTLWDNEGINIFSFVDTSNYVVTEGDSLIIRGEVGQFNGLTQFIPDSISLLNQNNSIPPAFTVTALNESTESELVTVNNVWVTSIAGANYTLSNGTNDIVMRVDSDTDVDENLNVGIGDTFCFVTGIGGQFDPSSPYDGGYQMFPRAFTDVQVCGLAPEPVVPFYPIPEINNVDGTTGEPDSLGVYCWTRGIVLGVDLDGNNGISFTIFDHEGINVFNFNDVSNYVVTEGDSIMVRGNIDFYNGLTEIFPDSIMVINSGNMLPPRRLVTSLDESTESAPIRIVNVMVVDTAQWFPGGSRNIDLVTCSGDTIVMRVDSDTEILDSIPDAPTGMFTVSGIGGQFDPSSPHFDGYQIFPMTVMDLDFDTDFSAPELFINELMADNSTAVSDEAGDFDPWIELYNGSMSSVELMGLGLTDDAGDLTKWQMRMGAGMMDTASFALAWADDEMMEGPTHTNFMLNPAGGYLALVSYDGCTIIDDVTYPALGADESFGRQLDGGEPWVTFSVSTPNASNEPNSISEIAGTDALIAFPNPASSVVRLSSAVDYQLFSMTGQVIIEARQANTIVVSNLSSGLYILSAEGQTIRLVVE